MVKVCFVGYNISGIAWIVGQGVVIFHARAFDTLWVFDIVNMTPHVIHQDIDTFESHQPVCCCVGIVFCGPQCTKVSMADAKFFSTLTQGCVGQHVAGLHSITSNVGSSSAPHQSHGICKVLTLFSREAHKPIGERTDVSCGNVIEILFHSFSFDIFLHDVQYSLTA